MHPVGDGSSHQKLVGGKTTWVSAAGIALLLYESLGIGAPVSIQFAEGEPRRGRIVWFDKGMQASATTTLTHIVAFDQPVDPSLVRQWVSPAESRSEAQAPVQLVVHFQSTQTDRGGQGTCMDLSRTVNPVEDSLIDTVVNRLCGEASPSQDRPGPNNQTWDVTNLQTNNPRPTEAQPCLRAGAPSM